jgi:hypothetical protein
MELGERETMKRKITFLMICACSMLVFGVKAQPRPRRQQQRANQPQSAKSFDGKWHGRTEQGRVITFTVLKGRITEFSAEGRFESLGCSTTSSTTATLNQLIVNQAFSFSAPGGPGGLSLRVNGNFSSSTTAHGVAGMQLHSIPGPPPGVPGHVPSCAGSLRTTWTACKGDCAPSPPPANPTASTRTRPALVQLISPKEGELLDNGCRNFKDPKLWQFRWSEVRGAQRYHLYVKHEFAGNPVIDNSNIRTTSYTDEDNSFSLNLSGWRWKVRPMINGVWKDWSAEQAFNVEPADTDCGGE